MRAEEILAVALSVCRIGFLPGVSRIVYDRHPDGNSTFITVYRQTAESGVIRNRIYTGEQWLKSLLFSDMNFSTAREGDAVCGKTIFRNFVW